MLLSNYFSIVFASFLADNCLRITWSVVYEYTIVQLSTTNDRKKTSTCYIVYRNLNAFESNKTFRDFVYTAADVDTRDVSNGVIMISIASIYIIKLNIVMKSILNVNAEAMMSCSLYAETL